MNEDDEALSRALMVLMGMVPRLRGIVVYVDRGDEQALVVAGIPPGEGADRRQKTMASLLECAPHAVQAWCRGMGGSNAAPN